eukprot:758811-Hanusia_phi.AAC.2
MAGRYRTHTVISTCSAVTICKVLGFINKFSVSLFPFSLFETDQDASLCKCPTLHAPPFASISEFHSAP